MTTQPSPIDGASASPPWVRRDDGKPTVCLCMIVRDEERVIRRCLTSVLPLIDAWCICDTGSEDETMSVVRETLAELPGVIHQRRWRDFGHNRTEALELARPWADYLLVIDADDTLELPEGFERPALRHDGYYTPHRIQGSLTSYYRLQLVRSTKPWRYVGVLHEVMVCDEPHTDAKLESFVCLSHHDGARNAVTPEEKYARDAEVLEAVVRDDPGDARSVFYLAQSHRDAGSTDRAIETYLRRAAMGGWGEEVYCSLLQAGQLHLAQGREVEGREALLAAYESRPTRREALVALARHHRLERRFQLARLYAGRAVELPRPDDLLFLDETAYAYAADDEVSVAAYWLQDYAACIEHADRALQAPSLPAHDRARIQRNRELAVEKLSGPAPARIITRVPFEQCPLCDASNLVEIRVSGCEQHPLYHPSLDPTMRWLRCDDCEHVFVDGYFASEAEQLLFAKANPTQRPGADLHGARRNAARMVEAVVAVRGSATGRWLDVGFGNGALMGAAEEFGFSPVGLEVRAENVDQMRRLGFAAHSVGFLGFVDEDPYDVVSMADVLEHMAFPRQALDHAHELLGADGVLFLSMPNLDAYVWRHLDDLATNPYWSELEHLHNFGRRRLEALLRAHGFEPMRYAISERYIACMEVIAKKV